MTAPVRFPSPREKSASEVLPRVRWVPGLDGYEPCLNPPEERMLDLPGALAGETQLVANLPKGPADGGVMAKPLADHPCLTGRETRAFTSDRHLRAAGFEVLF